MNNLNNQIELLRKGDIKTIARCISLVENEAEGYEELLEKLPSSNVPIIGITGPPGAGKSTITDALIEKIVQEQKNVAVLCVDPSSPFNMGALLGDRIRMSDWYNNPNVFIRSLATKGSLGGLHPKIIEITELLKAAQFDYIIVETVGVGQSEIEIAGLADVTVVVMVPESGDEVQSMKAGVMEIANIFVVNKSERPGADLFVKNLRLMLSPEFGRNQMDVPVLKTIASQKQGTGELFEEIKKAISRDTINSKRFWLLAERAWYLIQQKKMAGINKEELAKEIENSGEHFNLYKFIKKYC